MTRDAAIVLGAAVWRGGLPSPALARRAEQGARLVLEGRARVLVASGGTVTHPPAEATLIRAIAVELGVAHERILVEDASRDTLENALACAALLRAHGLRSAWLVTDRYHLGRALFVFRRLGIEATGFPAEAGLPSRRERLRELGAWPWTLVRIAALRVLRPRSAAGPPGDVRS
ncbi:MAG TPA: YdcF family protein [Myxococcota bacterium]|nr:YdcF family protein [Myxococcota bacterium]